MVSATSRCFGGGLSSFKRCSARSPMVGITPPYAETWENPNYSPSAARGQPVVSWASELPAADGLEPTGRWEMTAAEGGRNVTAEPEDSLGINGGLGVFALFDGESDLVCRAGELLHGHGIGMSADRRQEQRNRGLRHLACLPSRPAADLAARRGKHDRRLPVPAHRPALRPAGPGPADSRRRAAAGLRLHGGGGLRPGPGAAPGLAGGGGHVGRDRGVPAAGVALRRAAARAGAGMAVGRA